MTSGYFKKKFFFTDILLHSAFGVFGSECEWSLSCFRCMSENATYLASVTLKKTHTHNPTATEN